MEKGSHTSHLNPRRIYLFNDIILYTKLDQSKECVQGVLYLKALRVEESPQNDLFIIHDESGGSGKSWDFKPDKMMLTRWIKDLRKYIKLAKKMTRNSIACPYQTILIRLKSMEAFIIVTNTVVLVQSPRLLTKEGSEEW